MCNQHPAEAQTALQPSSISRFPSTAAVHPALSPLVAPNRSVGLHTALSPRVGVQLCTPCLRSPVDPATGCETWQLPCKETKEEFQRSTSFSHLPSTAAVHAALSPLVAPQRAGRSIAGVDNVESRHHPVTLRRTVTASASSGKAVVTRHT
jgi:hypothetical protein